MAGGLAAMRIPYDKLVRDKVPDAIRADGHTCHVEVLGPEEYVTQLKRKLVEEAREALEASSHDDLVLELADLMEVVRSLCAATGVTLEAVEAMRLQRQAERGGFDQRLLLRFVDRADLNDVEGQPTS
jgi:predicted house-cleaning noncanonical NTP pyrophosphatase (MazG superfamily)